MVGSDEFPFGFRPGKQGRIVSFSGCNLKELPGYSVGDFFGVMKTVAVLKVVGDLQLGDKKGTLNHLVWICLFVHLGDTHYPDIMRMI